MPPARPARTSGPGLKPLQLVGTAQALQFALSLERAGAVRKDADPEHGDRRVGPGVAGAAPGQMLGVAPWNIRADSAIPGAVPAGQEVNEPWAVRQGAGCTGLRITSGFAAFRGASPVPRFSLCQVFDRMRVFLCFRHLPTGNHSGAGCSTGAPPALALCPGPAGPGPIPRWPGASGRCTARCMHRVVPLHPDAAARPRPMDLRAAPMPGCAVLAPTGRGYGAPGSRDGDTSALPCPLAAPFRAEAPEPDRAPVRRLPAAGPHSCRHSGIR